MTERASGPGPADWLAALLRSIHPVRWLLCLAALGATVGCAVLAQSWFDGEALRWQGWWWHPVEQAQALGHEIAGRSLGAVVFRLGLLVAVAAGVWCLAAGWIARHELLARMGGRADIAGVRLEPGPTALVVRRRKDLVLCCTFVVVFVLLLLLPIFLAGRLNAWMGGVGAVLVSLLLPVLLVTSVVLLAVAFGVLSWPLMPVALAAEYTDSFDALSRAYNYALQRALLFLPLTVVAVALAGVPLAAALALVGGPLAAWQADGRQTVLWLGAGLAASVFWSLETLVYLHLRAAMDGVDAGEVALESSAESPRHQAGEGAAAPERAPGAAAPSAVTSRLRQLLVLPALAVGAWWLTAWLFARTGSEETAWLGWGMGETFVPPAQGLYRVASVIAGGMGALWVGLTLVAAVRGRRQEATPPEG